MSNEGFLGTITKPARNRLRKAMTIQNYDRDNLIISHKEETDDIYFVLTGRARATIYSENGKMVSFRDALGVG